MNKYEMTADTTENRQYWKMMVKTVSQRSGDPELRCELMTGYAFSRYEQFETSPETIEQEMRPGVC